MQNRPHKLSSSTKRAKFKYFSILISDFKNINSLVESLYFWNLSQVFTSLIVQNVTYFVSYAKLINAYKTNYKV